MFTIEVQRRRSQGLEMRRFGLELLEPNRTCEARAPRDHPAEAV